MNPQVAAEIATWMGVVPLVWLAILRETRDIGWFWLALAFAISWVVDMAALAVDPMLLSRVYPLSQAAIVGVAVLSVREFFPYLILLSGVAIVSLFVQSMVSPDVALHTIAWLSVAAMVATRWELGRLRMALLVYFGLGTVCWWAYVARPGWASWSMYQLSRAIGIAWFCYSTMNPRPALRMVR